MKPIRVRARQTVGGLLRRTGLNHVGGASLAVLMYHAVTQTPLEDDGQMSVSRGLFAEQMAALRAQNVDVVPLEEGVRRLAAGMLGGPAVSVVFDDGYVGVHDYALESLIRWRIPATVFVPTGWVGRAGFPFAPGSLGRPLTWKELSTLVTEGGCTIGSHTHTHLVLTRLDDEEVRSELRRSREEITGHLGRLPRVFAYPYGAYGTFNERTRRALAQEGFVAACTTVWGRQRPQDHPLEVKRIRVSWCDTGDELLKSLAGCYDWYRGVQRLQTIRLFG